MLLVPRQLRRSGLTGDVPYYGGRMSPAQAYAASHRRDATAPPPPPAPAPSSPPRARSDSMEALDRLLETGVVTREEYDDLRTRVDG